MPIADGKKRYYLTLDQQSMEEAQRLVTALKLPKQTVSLVIDEFLRGDLIPRLENILEKKQAGKQLSFGEIFLSVGGANLVTDGEHKGQFTQLWLKSVDEDGTMIVEPKVVDESGDEKVG